MRSFLKNPTVFTLLFTLLFVFSNKLIAEDNVSTPSVPATGVGYPQDEIYPDYPPIKAENPEQESLIKKGEYLAKMGDCLACHTNIHKRSPAFSGGLPIETPFGTFYSPNITPDKETGIGNWSEQDFIRAMKEGIAPDGSNYFPVFPYLYFSKTTEEDLKAMYAYFMSMPAVKQKNKSLPFPFNVPGARLTLWGWNMLFFFSGNEEFFYDTSKSTAWNRGKYIVDTLGHCGMCHTPLNPFGAPKDKYYMTGGFVDGFWAPNITKLGLESASHQEVANVFKHNQLINNAGAVAGPMAEVNYNSLKHLTDSDQLAIAEYLKTVESKEYLGVPPSDAKPTLQRGKQVYRASCVICHQEGQMTAPRIGDSPNWYMRVMNHGFPKIYKHAIEGFNSMPVKGACVTCSDNDIIAATDYILDKSLTRSQWQDIRENKEAVKPVIDGKVVYQAKCSSCHDSGQNGAPKIGDTAVWQPLMDKGFDVLVGNVENNIQHPKEGACESCSTKEIIEAIKYMLAHCDTGGNYELW